LIFVDKKWLLDHKNGCRPPFNLVELIDFENELEEFESLFEQDKIMDIKFWIFFHFSTIVCIFSMFKNKN
jgi:hypothetical protein